jgi:hypothetical protein
MNLSNDFYVGIVEDNIDPERRGRIKIRVQTLYHTMAVEDIPYAYPIHSLAGKEFQIPAIGKLVNVLFLSNDLYSPYYMYSENYNQNLKNKLKDLNDEEYVNFTAMLFDESTQIFIKGKELTIDQLLNKITIDNATINLELKDNEEILNLGSRGADQDAVLGTRFFEWMDQFIDELSLPYSLMGNMGAPILKTNLDVLCQKYKLLRPDFVSNNVKIVDNGEVKILKREPEVVNNKNDIDLVIPIEEDPILNQSLNASILEQNNKACDQLKYAAPTNIVPLRKTDIPILPSNKIKTTRENNNQSYIDELHPNLREYVSKLITRIEGELNIKMQITDGYRSIEKQKQLILAGNKDAAKPGRSLHQYGLAVDMWPLWNGKKITKATKNTFPYWDDIGDIAKSIGFRWGMYFKNPGSEPWHFDMSFGFNWVELLKRYENLDFIEPPFVNLGEPQDNPNKSFNGQDYKVKNDSFAQNVVSDPCASVKKFNAGEGDRLNSGSVESGESSDENEGAIKDESTLTCKEKNAKLLLDQISKGEGTTNKKAVLEGGAQSAYDITYAYGQYTPKTLPSGKSVQPLSNLTIGEIKEVQALMLGLQTGRSSKSSAVGKYQFISGTLKELCSAAGIGDDIIFNADTQDRLAMQKLIRSRGYDSWLNGKKSDHDFQKGLAKEWASIADPDTQKSYYHQHVGTTDSEIKDIMKKIKNSDCTS